MKKLTVSLVGMALSAMVALAPVGAMADSNSYTRTPGGGLVKSSPHHIYHHHHHHHYHHHCLGR